MAHVYHTACVPTECFITYSTYSILLLKFFVPTLLRFMCNNTYARMKGESLGFLTT